MLYVCLGVLALTKPDYEKLRSLYFDAPVTKGKKSVPFFSDEIFAARNAERERKRVASQQSFEQGQSQRLEPETKSTQNSLAFASKNHTERLSFLDFAMPKEMQRRADEPTHLYKESEIKRPPLNLDEVEDIDSEEVSVFDALKEQIFGFVPESGDESILEEVASALPNEFRNLSKGALDFKAPNVLKTPVPTLDSLESALSRAPLEAVYDEDLEYLDVLTNKGIHSFDVLTRGDDSLGDIFAEIVAGEKQSIANFDASVFDANVQMIYGEVACEKESEHVDEMPNSEEAELTETDVSESVADVKEARPVVVFAQETPPVATAVPRRRRISMIDIALFLIVVGLIAFLVVTSLNG